MRIVTRKVVESFIAGSRRTVGNTRTDGTILTLHGNRIAERMPDGSIVATLAGWPTVTTRERLNGLTELLGLGRYFGQSKHVQFYGSRPIESNEDIVLIRPYGKLVTAS